MICLSIEEHLVMCYLSNIAHRPTVHKNLKTIDLLQIIKSLQISKNVHSTHTKYHDIENQ